jgi:hypothetical protein
MPLMSHSGGPRGTVLATVFPALIAEPCVRRERIAEELIDQPREQGQFLTGLWVPKTYAARRCSWMMPPIRSWRRTRK